MQDMTDKIVETANDMVKAWESKIETNGGVVDLPIEDYVRSYSATVISKILFGSNYAEGAQILPKYRALLKAMTSSTILNGIPFLRFYFATYYVFFFLLFNFFAIMYVNFKYGVTVEIDHNF